MHFIRHGESEFNVVFAATRQDPGVRDAGLTARGREQAKSAARLLKERGITRILSSPYARALETASILAQGLGIARVGVSPLLGERALYSCDVGTCLSNLKAAWIACDFAGMENEEWWPGQGETQEEIQRRVHAFLALENDPATLKSTLCVSHWYFIYTATGLDADNADIVWRDEKSRFHKGF